MPKLLKSVIIYAQIHAFWFQNAKNRSSDSRLIGENFRCHKVLQSPIQTYQKFKNCVTNVVNLGMNLLYVKKFQWTLYTANQSHCMMRICKNSESCWHALVVATTWPFDFNGGHVKNVWNASYGFFYNACTRFCLNVSNYTLKKLWEKTFRVASGPCPNLHGDPNNFCENHIIEQNKTAAITWSQALSIQPVSYRQFRIDSSVACLMIAWIKLKFSPTICLRKKRLN